MPEDLPPCPECGAPGVGGEEGCERRFQEVVGREFSHPELFRVHRLTVDAYSLQHPDRYMRSAKSAVAHLAGMQIWMEGDQDPRVSQAVSRFLDGNPDLERPGPMPGPMERGALTVLHPFEAADSEEHLARVEEWALSVWEAWAPLHPQARQWVRRIRELGRGGRRRP